MSLRGYCLLKEVPSSSRVAMASHGHVFLDVLSSRSFCLFVSTIRLGTLPPNQPFVFFVYMNPYTHTLLLLLFSYFRSSRGVGITKSHFRYVRPDSCVRSAHPLKRDNQGPPIMGAARLNDPVPHVCEAIILAMRYPPWAVSETRGPPGAVNPPSWWFAEGPHSH